MTYPVSGADSLQVRRAYLRRGGSRRGHDRRLIARWVVIGVVVLCKQDERPRPSPREEITREAPPVEPKETALKT